MKTRGFTLIEILVVIVIISIVASVAMLSIHFNRKKELSRFANQIAQVILLAENEAMLRSATLGVIIDKQFFQFDEYDEKNNAWQKSVETVFRNKKIPDNMQVILKIENETIAADDKPHLIISPSGDLPAFIIFIGNKNEAPLYQVIGEPNGNVYVQ